MRPRQAGAVSQPGSTRRMHLDDLLEVRRCQPCRKQHVVLSCRHAACCLSARSMRSKSSVCGLGTTPSRVSHRLRVLRLICFSIPLRSIVRGDLLGDWQQCRPGSFPDNSLSVITPSLEAVLFSDGERRVKPHVLQKVILPP